MAKIISKCCICKVVYDEKEIEGSTGGVSHGYCEPCLVEDMEKVAQMHKITKEELERVASW